MHSNILGQVEEMSHSLSKDEILWLIDRFIHRLRESEICKKQVNLKGELIAMAKDPEIQMELNKISHEFGVTESDGLGDK